MNIRKLVFWMVAIVAVALISIPLAGAVEAGFIQPMIRFAWILKGYYGSIHQAIVWGLAMSGLAVIAGLALRAGSLRMRDHNRKNILFPGEVGQLAFWIRRAHHGLYPRWYLARTLADLAMEILRGRGINVDRGGELQGPNWEPPEKAQKYLETALRTTPATFGRQLESAHGTDDPDAESIVEYFESYLEGSNEH